jgi:alcohol dehydrogenase (cytochrome c)
MVPVAVVLSPLRRQLVPVVGLMVNYIRTLDAPAGTLTVETARSAAAVGPNPTMSPPAVPMPETTSLDWPSYNRTLSSERYSPLGQIDRHNVGALKVLCTYDTKQRSSFQTGLIMVDGALIGTTEPDIFSIDPVTCAENWRTHEEDRNTRVNRGAAYLDGLLFRGTGDGRVLAYDFKTGARVWQTAIANPQLGESITASPIAWNGLIFIGNAGGDEKGVKGRMYALDAKTGKIVWEFYLVPKGPHDLTRGPQAATPLDSSTWGNQPGTPITGGATWTSYTLDPATGELYVPAGNAAPDFATGPRKGANLYAGSVVVLDAKTGAYKRHFSLAPGDWHDYDVSNTPALIRTRGGTRLLAVTPKDGYLYGFNLDSDALIYRTPVDRIENADVPFSTDAAVHFCPGTRGGAEWNGPAYDPQSNLILVGEVDWCSSIRLQTDAQIRATKLGGVWTAMATHNPYNTYGEHDPYRQWGGWVYASDADTGEWRWRARTNYPIQSGITATAGGVVFFGDMGGNFYALDTATGKRLWGANLGGAIGGGVVTYAVGGAQKVAVAAGFTAILWPTKVVTGKIVILGLPPS